VGDTEGFQTLIGILSTDEAGFARQQAIELLESESGQKFGYDPEKSVAENENALNKIRDWWTREGSQLRFDPRTQKFHSP
jgi:hypothetical protein